MTTWRLRLRPKGSWVTPWRSDSLFGAICWRWLELFPESFEEMLNGFHESASPPFCLSDAWPDNLLPLPANAQPETAYGKKVKPPFYVTELTFGNLIRGVASTAAVLTNAVQASSRLRTSIDRELGTAADGQLFEIDTQHLAPSFNYLSIYLRSEHHLQNVVACLKAQSFSGFGKKKLQWHGRV